MALGKQTLLAKGAWTIRNTEAHWAFAEAGANGSPEAHQAIENH